MLYKYEKDTEINYFSNNCGELYNNGKDLELSELPTELRIAFDTLFEENKFGLDNNLVEFKGQYGICISALYDRCYAEDLGITIDALNKIALDKAVELSNKYDSYSVIYGELAVMWSDGNADTIVGIIIPWDESMEKFEEIGSWFTGMCYVVDAEKTAKIQPV